MGVETVEVEFNLTCTTKVVLQVALIIITLKIIITMGELQ